MLIRRCAWHRTYQGHWRLSGIASWRGWGLAFTDGVCPSCTARVRREGNLPPLAALERAVGWSFFGGALPRTAVAFVAVAALVLMSRPLDDLRGPRNVTAPPTVALAVPAAVDGDARPAVAVSSVTRRVGPAHRLAVIRVAVPRSVPSTPRPFVRLVLRRPADPPPIYASRTTVLALETTHAPAHAGLTLQTQ